MQVICPKCQKRYLVSADQAGQTARCGNCKATFLLKAPEEPSVPEAGDAPQSGPSAEIPDLAPAPVPGTAAIQPPAVTAVAAPQPSPGQPGESSAPAPGTRPAGTEGSASPAPNAGEDTPFAGDTKASHWKPPDQEPEPEPRRALPKTEAPSVEGDEAPRDDDPTPFIGGRAAEDERAVDSVFKPGEVVLGLYSVAERIGEGGMGAVYRVHHRGWNVDLAVKYPRPTALKSDKAQQRFVREAEAWVDLGLHPNVTSCFYVREIEGLPCIFMEYVDGGNLLDWEREDKARTIAEIIDLAIQVCDGMVHAHQRGLIHRDLKPANCLMTKAGIVKITDFGLVKWTSEEAEGLVDILDGEPISRGDISLTTVDGLSGTPPYMPPEQWGRLPEEPELPPVSRVSDIYAFGVLLFEMVCGRRPFDGPTISLADLRKRHRDLLPPDPTRYRDDTPFELRTVIFKAMEKAPEDRYQSFEEIRKALEETYRTVTDKPYPRKPPSEARLVAADLNNRAISLHDLGRVTEAQEALERALAADPSHLESNYNRSLLEWRSGRITDVEVVRRLQEIRNAAGFSWRAPYLLALVHLERRDTRQAEAILAEACQAPDVQAQAWIALGDALAGSGKLSKALEAYRQALALKGDAREVLTRAAVTLYMAGEKRKAEQVLKEPIGADLEAQIYHGGATQKTFSGHGGPIRAVAMSQDARIAASIGQAPDNSLRAWDLTKGNCLLNVSEAGVSYTSIAMSPCGRFLLSGSTDNRIRLWDLPGVECMWTSESQPTSPSFVTYYEPDDLAAAISATDGTLRLWNTLSGRLLGAYQQGEAVSAFSAAADLKRAVSTNGRSWFVWNLEAGEWERFPMSAQPITAIAISREGRHALVALEADHVIQFWDLETKSLLRELRGHTGDILSLDFGPDAATGVSSAKDNTLRLWYLDRGQCVLSLSSFAGHGAPIRMSHSGQYCLWGGWDRTLRLWNLGTRWPPASLTPAEIVSSEDAIRRQSMADELIEKANNLLGERRWGDAAAVIRKARKIAGRERDPELMRLWSRAGLGGRRRSLRNGWALRTFRTDEPVNAVAFSSDSRMVLAGDTVGNFMHWDLGKGGKPKRLGGHTSLINAIETTAHGLLALTGSGVGRGGDTTARLWDLESGRPLVRLECIQGANDVALSFDAKLALIGTNEVLREAPLRLWHLERRRPVRDFEEHSEAVTAVAIHPGSCLAVSGFEDGSVALWDLCSGKCLGMSADHSGMITAVAFSPDGRAFLSACMDGEVRIRPVRNSGAGKALKCSGPVSSATFSPDSQFILVGCLDQTMQFWSATTGQRLRVFQGHTGEVKAVAFSPEGRFALSGSSDRSVVVWELDWHYEFPPPVDWHAAAAPFLENFLSQQCPMTEAGLREGPPQWNDEALARLVTDLQRGGFGWVQPGGIPERLKALAENWQPPQYSS